MREWNMGVYASRGDNADEAVVVLDGKKERVSIRHANSDCSTMGARTILGLPMLS
jgi:hypothetical protein